MKTKLIKKHITDKQIKKLLKYISLAELEYQEEYWGKVPDGYWKYVHKWYEFLNHFLESYPIDHYILAIIMYEIQVQYHCYERKYLSYKDTIPIMHSGANGLLKALESFDENFLNIESIIIKTKSHTPFPKDFELKNLNDFRTKDSQPVTYKITGHEVILEIFKLLSNNKNIFETLSKSEEKLSGKTYDFIMKNKPKVYFRKISSEIFYNYLRDHLPKRTSDNKVFNIGGFLQYHSDFMPEPKKEFTTDKEFRNFLISNFKKSIYSSL